MINIKGKYTYPLYPTWFFKILNTNIYINSKILCHTSGINLYFFLKIHIWIKIIKFIIIIGSNVWNNEISLLLKNNEINFIVSNCSKGENK